MAGADSKLSDSGNPEHKNYDETWVKENKCRSKEGGTIPCHLFSFLGWSTYQLYF